MFTSFLIRRRVAPAMFNLQKAGFIVLTEEAEMRATKTNKGKHTVHFTEHEMVILRKLLKKMELHSESLSKESDSTDDEALPMEDSHHHHKHHESLKEIFSKHGANHDSEFMRDLKHWKHSH